MEHKPYPKVQKQSTFEENFKLLCNTISSSKEEDKKKLLSDQKVSMTLNNTASIAALLPKIDKTIPLPAPRYLLNVEGIPNNGIELNLWQRVLEAVPPKSMYFLKDGLHKGATIGSAFTLKSGQRYVCGPGPVNREHAADYYQMLKENGVPIAVSLTKLEKERSPCNADVLSKEHPTITTADGKTTYQFEKEEVCPVNPHIIVRTYTQTTEGKSQPFYHIHYTGWPDGREVPVAEQELLTSIIEEKQRELNKENPSAVPLAIRCRYTLGRTSKIIAALELIKQLGNTPLDSQQVETLISSLIDEIREHMGTTNQVVSNSKTNTDAMHLRELLMVLAKWYNKKDDKGLIETYKIRRLYGEYFEKLYNYSPGFFTFDSQESSKRDYPLVKAFREGGIKAMQELLTIRDQNTVLHEMIQLGASKDTEYLFRRESKEVIDAAIEKVLDPQASNTAMDDLKEVLEKLSTSAIGKGYNVQANGFDDQGKAKRSAVCAAIEANRFDLLELLSRYQSDFDDYEYSRYVDYAQNPLLMALEKQDSALVSKLETYGATYNAWDNNGRGLLSNAILLGKPHVIEALLEKGVPLDQADDKGREPLYYAVTEANFSLVATLLEKGVECPAPTKEDIESKNPISNPLLAAIKGEFSSTMSDQSQLHLLNILIRGGNADISTKQARKDAVLKCFPASKAELSTEKVSEWNWFYQKEVDALNKRYISVNAIDPAKPLSTKEVSEWDLFYQKEVDALNKRHISVRPFYQKESPACFTFDLTNTSKVIGLLEQQQMKLNEVKKKEVSFTQGMSGNNNATGSFGDLTSPSLKRALEANQCIEKSKKGRG